MVEGIAGKVVVITGGSSGLGEAAAKHLVTAGAAVVLGARRADRIEALASELRQGGGKALAVPVDVTDSGQVRSLVDTAVRELGHIDVMVNNAGIAPLSLLEQAKVEEWDQMIDVNIKGVLYGIAAALPYMKRQQSGHIVNVSSLAAYRVVPTAAVYSATKQAVRAISDGLRQEAGQYNIRATTIFPGPVASELTDSIKDPTIATGMKQVYEQVALPPESFARILAFAISQPDEVDVSEILFQPSRQR